MNVVSGITQTIHEADLGFLLVSHTIINQMFFYFYVYRRLLDHLEVFKMRFRISQTTEKLTWTRWLSPCPLVAQYAVILVSQLISDHEE